MKKLLIVDDEKSILNALRFSFEDDYEVLVAQSLMALNTCLLHHRPHIALIDLKFGKVSGLQVLDKLQAMYPETVSIVMTAYGTIETSTKAIKMGAYDYIEKPVDSEALRVLLKNALVYAERRKGILLASQPRLSILGQCHMIVHSSQMKAVMAMVDRISTLDVNVLVTGESGTGKELIVRAIHEKSPRSCRPLEIINCGAIPETLVESELFGHAKGAYTGASETRKGVFERADGGTLFLDEVGELSLAAQVKLLRTLQEGEIQPIGGMRKSVDVRVVAATNRNLSQEVQEGRFRADLFYRLNLMTLEVPPLRERREDIPPLVYAFMERANATYKTQVTGISKGALDRLTRYEYKGNVRELENIIYRAVIMSGEIIEEAALPIAGETFIGDDIIEIKVGAKMAEVEQAAIEKTLESVNGNRSKAAKILGISERSLYYKIKK